jgi:hypothetical protein
MNGLSKILNNGIEWQTVVMNGYSLLSPKP